MSDTIESAVPTAVAPVAIISSTDRSGLVVLITALGLSFVVICFLIRIYVRTKISGPWRGDDHFLTAATIFSLAQSAVIFLQTSKGYGKTIDHISPENLAEIGKTTFASDFLYILAMCFAKCSTAFLFLRLTPRRAHAMASWATIAASCVWALVSILLITVDCSATEPWSTDLNAQCSGLFARWAVIGALDIATELALFALSVYIVAELQMAWRLKATVVIVFSLRLPVIVLAALRIAYIKDMVASTNPTFRAALVSVWTQVEQDYSIMACTLPCLGPFIRPFATSYHVTEYPKAGMGSSSARSEDFNLNSLRSQSSKLDDPGRRLRVAIREGPLAKGGSLRPEKVTHQASASHDKSAVKKSGRGNDQLSIESNDSQQMIIKKKMTWNVEHGS